MAELLSEDELADQLPEGWEQDGDAIVRTYEFDGYMRGLAFAQTVGEIAETQANHPTMTIRPGAVEVRFTADDAGGVTDEDVQMAQFVDGEYGG